MSDSPSASDTLAAADALLDEALDSLKAHGINVEIYQEEGRDLFVIDRQIHTEGEIVALAARIGPAGSGMVQ